MIEIVQGDCLERLKDLPDNSVQMCVTSPPSLPGEAAGAHVDRVLPGADPVQFPALAPQALSPGDQLSGTATTAPVLGTPGVFNVEIDQCRRDSGDFTPALVRKSKQATVAHGLADHISPSITHPVGYFSEGQHGHIPPAWVFLFKPVRNSLVAAVLFGGSKLKQQFSLSLFNSQEWQQGFSRIGGNPVSSNPMMKRPAVFCPRFAHPNSTPKGVLEKLRNIGSYLFKSHSLAIAWAMVAPYSHRVGYTLDTKRAVAVHRTGKVGKDFVLSHYSHIPSNSGDVIIPYPDYIEIARKRLGLTERDLRILSVAA